SGAEKPRERVPDLVRPVREGKWTAAEARLVEGDQQNARVGCPCGRAPDAQVADPALDRRQRRPGKDEADRQQDPCEESGHPIPARNLRRSPARQLSLRRTLPEPAYDLTRGARAQGGIFPQRLGKGKPDFRRQREPGWFLFQVSGQDLCHRSLKWRLAAEELVGDHAE